MQGWGWAAKVALEDVTKAVATIATRRKFVAVSGRREGSVFLKIASQGNRVLVFGHGLPGAHFSAELAKTLKIAGRYAEVELQDKVIVARVREIAADGTVGPEDDRADEASNLCEQWFEGKKYRPEARDDLIATFLGFDDTPKADTQAYDRSGSARVAQLVDAIRRGAKWETTTIAGRSAIKVTEAGGATRMSVLDDAELEQFREELA